ncbi:glucose-6-phosphate isomerase, cytosolic-like [Chenopodium quinoa]|uniref:glucose-6-phosphate isomerase, cytosolic-like n=1 Tax=Chenopodium quinoa TaxID=63459 RepID=UPI000B77F67A|nr:glucose-6-phosphate isomerase, cytosolic-like [Chenopodium quinoa]
MAEQKIKRLNPSNKRVTTLAGTGKAGFKDGKSLEAQGRIIPCDFIGIAKSQQPVYLKGEVVSNHDELMSNFFVQPDALAYGKTQEELQKENVSPHLVPHKTFTGNRPSLSLLLPSLTAYNVGQLLAIYEHRIAVEGFVWGINSFDQWGDELGKSLATQVRKQLHASRTNGEAIKGFNFSTTTAQQNRNSRAVWII